MHSSLRDHFMTKFQSLDATLFRALFRMSRFAYETLRTMLGPWLQPKLAQKNIDARKGSNRQPLTIDEIICISLRIFGGAAYVDAAWGFNVSVSSVYFNFFRFIRALVRSNAGIIYFPTTASELQAASNQMDQIGTRHEALHGCVGAIDGIAIRIRQPLRTECSSPISYRNRKGFCSINMQAIAGGCMRFLWVSLESPGSTHDSTAFHMTKFSQKWLFENDTVDKQGRQFWLAGDDAYGAYFKLISPWPGQYLDTRAPYKDAFNYYFSGGKRNVIERVFGVMYQRWGILWRPLLYKLRLIPLILYAICRLHNFLIDVKDMVELPSLGSGMGYFGSRRHRGLPEQQRSVADQSGFDSAVHPQDECALEDAATVVNGAWNRNICSIREQITQNLENLQVLRPQFNLGRLPS